MSRKQFLNEQIAKWELKFKELMDIIKCNVAEEQLIKANGLLKEATVILEFVNILKDISNYANKEKS